MISQTRAFIFPMVILLFVSSAAADDTSAAVSAGGIEFLKSEEIALVEETLDITPTQVDVRFRFLNESKENITTTIAFPLPLGAEPEPNNGMREEPDRRAETVEPKEFKLWVDERPFAHRSERRYELNGADVSSRLRELGLLDTEWPKLREAIKRLPGEKVKELASEGLLIKNEDWQSYDPTWQVRQVFLWQVEFPPGKFVSVRHVYQPFEGKNSISQPYFYAEEGCFEPSVAASLRARFEGDGGYGTPGHSWEDKFSAEDMRPASWVEYVLRTGANWKGPIRKFTLTVSGAAYLGVCFEGTKQSGRGQLRIERTDYLPKEDLRIDFAGIGKTAKN